MTNLLSILQQINTIRYSLLKKSNRMSIFRNEYRREDLTLSTASR